MKSIRRKNLDELARIMPVINENELKTFVGGDKVVITITRNGYGENTTLGHFTAIAYDDSGQFIASITGVTLEPNYDESYANVGGSGTAIDYGTYQVVSGTYHNDPGYYQVSGVDGRTGIFFHIGNESGDTTGCILLGSSSCEYNGDYTISGSTPIVNSFNDFLKEYGDNGITLIIESAN